MVVENVIVNLRFIDHLIINYMIVPLVNKIYTLVNHQKKLTNPYKRKILMILVLRMKNLETVTMKYIKVGQNKVYWIKIFFFNIIIIFL